MQDRPFLRGPVPFDAGITNVGTAGTAVALSTDGGHNDEDRIYWAQFKGKPGNTGTVYVGIADVSGTGTIHGFPLENDDNEGLKLDIPNGGSVRLGDIFFDAENNNDKIAWAILYTQ